MTMEPVAQLLPETRDIPVSQPRSVAPRSRGVGILASLRETLLAARLAQIRKTASLILVLTRVRPVSRLITLARRWPPVRAFFHCLVGYRHAFPSLAEANESASRFIAAGHDSVGNARLHINLARLPRPSDYPVLFHLGKQLEGPARLFDLGGNVGNLFYCYQDYLSFSPDLRWIVHDVPEMLEIGRSLASERMEHRLSFTDRMEDLRQADILLASGSLHYLESDLPELLRGFTERPRHLLINRTPLTDREPVVTVQDATVYLCACRQIPRKALIRGLEELGYQLIDSWSVPELSLPIPFYPESSIDEYSGLYLTLKA
jgi:putative methyltransferase (TIGR04325 family)